MIIDWSIGVCIFYIYFGTLPFGNKAIELFDIYKEITDGNYQVILFHYPIAVWDKKHYGAVHLYGHIHSNVDLVKYTADDKAYNVCADVNDYEPKTLQELMNKNK